MKKQDVLDAIAVKYTRVLAVRLHVEPIEGVATYLVNVFDAKGDAGAKQNVSFYVVDEGDSGEAAYWQRSEPKPTPPTSSPTFQQLLQEHLNNLIGNGTIEGGAIQSVDAVNETATVSIWKVINSDLVLKQFFVDKDAQDIWQRREIVGV